MHRPGLWTTEPSSADVIHRSAMTLSIGVEARSISARLAAADRLTPVYRRRDLLADGVTDADLANLIRRHLVTRLRHGVYVPTEVLMAAEPAEVHRLHLAAAIAATDEPTWAFGRSAALVLGLPTPSAVPDAIELLRASGQDERALTRASKHRLTLPSMLVTTHVVALDDLTVVKGIPTVGRPLAAIATARHLSFRWRVAILDAVLWDGSVTAEQLTELNARWRSLGRSSLIDSAITHARCGAQTPLESLSRLALMKEGLPEPELQARFDDGSGLIGYVDMYWPQLRVVGEADGRIKYDSRDDLVREKIREDRLRALGLRVVRWMWSDIKDRPADVARRIRDASRLAA